MATAKRLYLYNVSVAGLSMLVIGAVVILHQLLSKVGVGPQNSVWWSNPDQEALASAFAVGAVGLALWLTHWAFVERMVAPSTPDALAERASIVRSGYFVVVLTATLWVAAGLLILQAGNVIANLLGAAAPSLSMSSLLSSSAYSLMPYLAAQIDDAWSLSVIIVLMGVWAYHSWIRTRDLRQGTVIGGSAAWLSRLYLYGAVYVGLTGALGAISSIISTLMGEWFGPRSGYTVDPMFGAVAANSALWVRPLVAALVGLTVWGAVWIGHWYFSNLVRSGRVAAAEQASAERASRVRLAFLMVIVFWGANSVITGLSSSLGSIFRSGLVQTGTGGGADLTSVYNLNLYGSSSPLWYQIVLPLAVAVPAALAWWWHRKRGFAEAPEGPAGMSAQRVAGYLVALVGISALASGAYQALSAVFGEWFASSPSASMYGMSYPTDSLWKYALSAGLGSLVAGLILWVVPWLFAQGRRVSDRANEIGSSARSYYLYLIAGASVIIGSAGLATVLYPYIRLGLGLPEPRLGSEVSGPLAILLVAAALFAYHAFVLRSDATPPPAAAPAAPVPPVAPTEETVVAPSETPAV
jgi:hypothetical protein